MESPGLPAPTSQQLRAIAFDFDGVILDSAGIKTDLFLWLYPEVSPELRAQIRAYCEAYGGVPRRDKLVHIETQILRRPLEDARVDQLCARFTEEVGARMRAAAWIPGAREFITAHHRDYLFYIISGSPHNELVPLCAERGLTPYFRGIAGNPPKKTEWVRRFLKESGVAPAQMVFIGDSLPDWQTAQDSGLRFVGVGQTGGWLPTGIPLIPDLRPLAETLKKLNAQ